MKTRIANRYVAQARSVDLVFHEETIVYAQGCGFDTGFDTLVLNYDTATAGAVLGSGDEAYLSFINVGSRVLWEEK